MKKKKKTKKQKAQNKPTEKKKKYIYIYICSVVATVLAQCKHTDSTVSKYCSGIAAFYMVRALSSGVPNAKYLAFGTPNNKNRPS